MALSGGLHGAAILVNWRGVAFLHVNASAIDKRIFDSCSKLDEPDGFGGRVCVKSDLRRQCLALTHVTFSAMTEIGRGHARLAR
jgi:hypothetical protein